MRWRFPALHFAVGDIERRGFAAQTFWNQLHLRLVCARISKTTFSRTGQDLLRGVDSAHAG